MGDAEFCDFVTKNLNVIFRQFSVMVAMKNMILLHFVLIIEPQGMKEVYIHTTILTGVRRIRID